MWKTAVKMPVARAMTEQVTKIQVKFRKKAQEKTGFWFDRKLSAW